MNTFFKALSLGLITPVFVFANADLGYLTTLVTDLGGLVGTLIPLVIIIGLLFFIWGLVQFIAASGDEAAKDEGKRKMIWGIVALFVIVAVWGLVEIVAGLFGVTVGEDLADTPGVTL